MVSTFGPSLYASIIFFISVTSSVSLLMRHCIILNRPLCILPRYILFALPVTCIHMRGVTFVQPGVSMSFILMSDVFEVALGVH